MAPTWREERPEAITAASHRAVRPSRSMVTTFSALSSSREARIRLSRSVCCAALRAGTAGFLADFFGFLTVFGDFFAGTFFAAFAAFVVLGFLPAGFLVRVRAEILMCQ